MSRKCSICAHQQGQAIDEALVAGTASLREIASLFAVSQSALRRHKARHLPAALAQAQEAQEAAHGDDLLNRLDKLTTEAHRIKDKAEKAGDYRTAIAGIRELVRIVEVLAKLRGQLDERAQINILVANPEWLTLRARILTVLEPYPEARLALAAALEVGNAGK